LLDEARLAIARIYEFKKQPQLALQSYEEITRTNLMSAVSAEANTRKEQLLAKHPELAKTNAPGRSVTGLVPTPAPLAPSADTNAGNASVLAAVTNSTPVETTNAAVPAPVTGGATNAPSPKP